MPRRGKGSLGALDKVMLVIPLLKTKKLHRMLPRSKAIPFVNKSINSGGYLNSMVFVVVLFFPLCFGVFMEL